MNQYPIHPSCAQSCPTLCDPMDCSSPGSSVHGIFQARLLEWVATSFSRGSSWPRDCTLQADALPSEPPGKPLEKEMATHSSVLAWRIPGAEEPGGLPSMGSHRVLHDWSDLAAAAACGSVVKKKKSTFWCRRCKRHRFYPWVWKILWRRKWQPTPVVLPRKTHGKRCQRRDLATEHAPTWCLHIATAASITRNLTQNGTLILTNFATGDYPISLR